MSQTDLTVSLYEEMLMKPCSNLSFVDNLMNVESRHSTPYSAYPVSIPIEG